MTIENARYLFTGSEVIERATIHVADGRILGISTGKNDVGGGDVIDASGFLVMPTFKNAHTHAAMTLLRGFGDDMKLQPWLETVIWPAEANLTPEDVYWGTRLAAVEMITSGTTFANDMYFHPEEVVRAFTDAGIKGAVGLATFDFFDDGRTDSEIRAAEALLERNSYLLPGTQEQTPPVYLVMSPHSIYACSKELLKWNRRMATENNTIIHIHMSETEKEVEDSLSTFGLRPFQYIDSLGILDSDVVAAHAIWLDAEEMDLVADAGLTVVHNPASNMKLSSGAFPWLEFNTRNVPMMLGPDGVASNNNLDMFDEMKLAALLQKHHFRDPERLPALDTLKMAVGGFSSVFPGISGALAPGEPADLMLLDLDHPQMVPAHNVVSNLVYAASSGAVDTVICDGKVLMRERKIPGTDEIIVQARRLAANLAKRSR